MGMLDRMLRVCTGIVLIVLGTLMLEDTAGIILMIVSIPLLISGITGFCPSYRLLGISTKREASCC
jgi:Inner membrane protein YgaP-like, transmembrane domain